MIKYLNFLSDVELVRYQLMEFFGLNDANMNHHQDLPEV